MLLLEETRVPGKTCSQIGRALFFHASETTAFAFKSCYLQNVIFCRKTWLHKIFHPVDNSHHNSCRYYDTPRRENNQTFMEVFNDVKTIVKLWHYYKITFVSFDRSFLYKYDYRSETNLQLPKYAATTDTIDEDLMSSLCLKNLPNAEGSRESTELACNALETNCKLLESKDSLKDDVSDESSCSKEKRKCSKDAPIESSSEHALNTGLSTVQKNCELLNTYENKVEIEEIHLKDNERIAKSPCKSRTGNCEKLTIQRAHTSPTLKITEDFDSKRKNKDSHRRALSFDSNILNKFKSHSPKPTKHNTIPHNVKHSTDLVIVVDNSNIFIGAQECASLLNPNERKRHIRVKIQQLVKVFQRGRVVSRAFVQGSSPPTTEQVWEVYR